MSFDLVRHNLREFKKSFYRKRLIKGLLFTLVIFICILIFANFLETLFWFSSPVRLVLFFIVICSFFLPLYSYVIVPTLELLKIKKGVSDENLAVEIGNHFPEISDKLLNIIQLDKSNLTNSNFLTAAIHQKSTDLGIYNFKTAVRFLDLKKYAWFLVGLIVTIGITTIVDQNLVFGAGKRIVLFSEEFEKPAPFQFQLKNESLTTFRNEDILLKAEITGRLIPDQVVLEMENRSITLKGKKDLEYLFENVQESFSFRFSASGFSSKVFQVFVRDRPEINSLSLKFNYPRHTRLPDEEMLNSGNAVVPQGTVVTWSIATTHTDSVFLSFQDEKIRFNRTDETSFETSKAIYKDQNYQLHLSNSFGSNKSRIGYTISVIEDLYPRVETAFHPDSIYFKSILITGSASDDYGFTKLALNYKTASQTKSIPLIIREFPANQSFIYEFFLDSILAKEESIDLWVEVFDNDAPNGFKKQSSEHFTFRKPGRIEMEKILDKSSSATERSLKSSQSKTDEINARLKQLEDRLKNQTNNGWQEEKLLKEIIDEKKALREQLEQLKEEYKQLVESQKEFLNLDEKLTEKSEMLKDMINQLVDEETMKLLEELQKLMEEKADNQKLMDKLSQVKPKEKNLEKELERTLELFKRLKLETEINKTADDLDQLGEKQQNLASEEGDEAKQEEINTEFKEIEKSLEQIEQLNQSLKKPEALEDFGDFTDEIEKDQQEISDEMESGSKGNTNQKQKNTGSKMKQMASKMEQMQSVLEMEAMEENIEQLRDILDNLVKLSFEEERIFKEIRETDQTDPRYLTLSQNQLSLIDNSKVIEDSLLALASRVIQISSYVTREITSIQDHLKMSMDKLKERQKNVATSHQQFAMASMNNLALLLDNTLQQMQMSMAEAMGNPKKGKGNKPQPKPSDLQQQLGEKIEQLKKSGAAGRELSEQLAKMAAEQALIRQMLEEQERKRSELSEEEGEGGSSLKEVIQKMEQNEMDLVNKRLTQNLINRQQEIVTRMLESEKSDREQEESPERESETARQQRSNFSSAAYEEYLKRRKKEIELLNTIPLELTPFYKKEVNDYFRRLSTSDQ